MEVIVYCIICGICIGLSVWTAWELKEQEKTISMLINMQRHIGQLYKTVEHIMDYLIGDHGQEEVKCSKDQSCE